MSRWTGWAERRYGLACQTGTPFTAYLPSKVPTLLILPLTSGIRLLPHLQLLDVIMLQRPVHPCVVIIGTAPANCATEFACYAYSIRSNSNRTMKLVALASMVSTAAWTTFSTSSGEMSRNLVPHSLPTMLQQSIRVHGSQTGTLITAPPKLDLLPAHRPLPQATQSQSNYNTQGLAFGTRMIFLPSLQLTVALEWWLLEVIFGVLETTALANEQIYLLAIVASRT